MKRKLSLSLLIVFFTISICFSEEPNHKIWEYYGEISDGDIYYYNKTNIRKSSNIISVWTYRTVPDKERKETIEMVKNYYSPERTRKYQNYDHDNNLYDIDCKNKKYRVKEMIHYDDKGTVINYIERNNSKWNSIVSDSIFELLYNRVCVTSKKPLKKK